MAGGSRGVCGVGCFLDVNDRLALASCSRAAGGTVSQMVVERGAGM